MVSPTFAPNRDEVEKQVGHKIVVIFLQQIEDDSISYQEKNKKHLGYNVFKGNKELEISEFKLFKGCHGNSAKKNHRI